ncbi:hypothetical protein DDI_1776 [Dickeya dianthicola RNS04.9]|nr:hypothetical protein DDI_1776 [Dickeya dianthicola RNS04.9]
MTLTAYLILVSYYNMVLFNTIKALYEDEQIFHKKLIYKKLY